MFVTPKKIFSTNKSVGTDKLEYNTAMVLQTRMIEEAKAKHQKKRELQSSKILAHTFFFIFIYFLKNGPLHSYYFS